MSSLYPVLLDLRGARVLVVGGGEVALRKVRALVESGSRPVVIAPAAAAELEELAAAGRVEWRRREYESGDATGHRLVIAATDRAEVNAAVAAEAEGAGAWVNVVDAPELSTFQVPASIREGAVTVAFSTGGAAPLLARRLRERLAGVVTPGLGRAVARLQGVREEVRARWPEDEARRRAFWFSLLSDEFLACAIAGRDDEVEDRIEQCLSQS